MAQSDEIRSNPGFIHSFTAHPASVGESYGQHLLFALRFSGRLFLAAGAAFVHAVVPAWFETTASDQIKALHAEITERASGSS